MKKLKYFLPFILIGLIIILGLVNARQRYNHLVTEGEYIHGRAYNKVLMSGKRWEIYYSYVVDGKEFVGTSSFNLFSRSPGNINIPGYYCVIYAKGNPALSTMIYEIPIQLSDTLNLKKRKLDQDKHLIRWLDL